MDDIDTLLQGISDSVFWPAKNILIADLYEKYDAEDFEFKPSELLFHVHKREEFLEVYITPKELFDLDDSVLYDEEAYCPALEEIGLAYETEAVCGVIDEEAFNRYTVKSLRAKLLETGFIEMSEEAYQKIEKGYSGQ